MELIVFLIQYLLLGLLFGSLVYAFTYWRYKEKLNAAKRFSQGLQYYRDLLIEEGEEQKSRDDNVL